MIRLEVVKGSSGDWIVQGRTRVTGSVPTGFLDTDALACRVWAGDDQATLLAPAVAWSDAPTCRVAVSVNDADAAALDPGVYRCQITAARGGRTVVVVEAAFVVLDAPGLATPLPVYCTAQDVANECGWIGQMLNLDSDQTGFAELRAEARLWLDGVILNAYPGAGWSNAFPGVPTWGRSGLLTNPWLKGILDGGGLMLTGPRGRKAVKACVYYTLSRVFRTLLGPGDKMASQGEIYARRANSALATAIVEIDTDGDGVANLAIPLCVTNTRRG